jgi:hypothetical protein
MSQIFLLLLTLFAFSGAFKSLTSKVFKPSTRLDMSVTITEGVQFDTIAREWRLKWNPDDDKKSLADVQKVLDKYIADIKAVDGVANVQRVVCGGCMDFKVITSLPNAAFEAWEGKQFAPEEKFLEEVKAIPGVSTVETQTFTLMPM